MKQNKKSKKKIMDDNQGISISLKNPSEFIMLRQIAISKCTLNRRLALAGGAAATGQTAACVTLLGWNHKSPDAKQGCGGSSPISAYYILQDT